jgi:hypothetical protein
MIDIFLNLDADWQVLIVLLSMDICLGISILITCTRDSKKKKEAKRIEEIERICGKIK